MTGAIQIFVAALAVTVLLLTGTVITGLKGLRKKHFVFVALTVVSLAATIVCAERMGRDYDLEAAGIITPIHLTLAKITALAYLVPIVTGFLLLKNPARRPIHRRAAFAVLGFTAVTFVTGTWMILAADPKSSVVEAAAPGGQENPGQPDRD